MMIESQIPIHGIDVDVFKMIIEWIYTMDIKSLSDPKTTGNIIDLERVYVAANMYNLCDLCDALVRYLEQLVDEDNFGEVYQIAKRIGVVSLETSIFRSWMSNSVSFNEKNDQINLLLHDFEDVRVEETQAIEPKRDEKGENQGIEGVSKEQENAVVIEMRENASLFDISRKFVSASNWEGDSKSKLCVIKCLATFLK
jgi:hypothetical protein